MTSKEIIEKKIKLALHDFMAEDNSYYYELQIKEYKQVLKDLEILEILKRVIFLTNDFYYIQTKKRLNEEDYKKVKEWLDA